jgi:phosphomannomutase
MIDERIFKAYDIRGTYPDQINGEAAYEIGKAFASYVGDAIVVGRDMRESSAEIFENFVRAINEMGVDVVDLGLCTTPMLNFVVAHKNFKGGAMITASHNPANYNGIKLIGEKAVQLNKERGISQIKELVFKNGLKSAENKGAISTEDILGEYLNYICSKIGEVKPLKLVVDCGNGVAGISASPAFERLGFDVEKMYFEPDGTFPNHQPNPAEDKNLKDCENKVLEVGADLGIVFDGDGDRAFFVDKQGRTHNPGFLLAAIADQELKGKEGQKVYYDLRFSKGVVETIEKAGGIAVKTKVGNPFFKEQLIMGGGLMAAEYSGHFMYGEHYGLDDGLFSALKVISWMSKTGQTFSEFLAPYEAGRFVTGEINFEVEDPQKSIERLEDEFKDGKIDHLDGVTIEYDDWWVNLRASNTEPVVRLNIEANSEQLLNEKKEAIIKIVKG